MATVEHVNLATVDRDLQALTDRRATILALPSQPHILAEYRDLVERIDELLDIRLAIR